MVGVPQWLQRLPPIVPHRWPRRLHDRARGLNLGPGRLNDYWLRWARWLNLGPGRLNDYWLRWARRLNLGPGRLNDYWLRRSGHRSHRLLRWGGQGREYGAQQYGEE